MKFADIAAVKSVGTDFLHSVVYRYLVKISAIKSVSGYFGNAFGNNEFCHFVSV